MVVPAPDAGDLTLDEIAAWCRDQGLSTYRIPERLELVASLPKNPAGKVLKDELRNRYSGT